MKTRISHSFAGSLVLIGILLPALVPEYSSAQTSDTAVGTPAPNPTSQAQLEQLLAPIALYPDALLAQIMMAATYPLEVVQADRWLQDSNNADLQGDELSATLEQQPWDPSIKSLVPFPQVLRMMDGNLAWTEQLGDAFITNQSALMDAVQQLRERARAAGTLQSTPQQVVSYADQVTTITPPSTEIVYVPVYDPVYAYGPWPYAEYPPYYFPSYFGGVSLNGYGFGWIGIGIVLPLWEWGHWDWGHHRLRVGNPRFGTYGGQRRPTSSGDWQHDPAHRHGVPYMDAGARARFNPQSNTARQNFRGYPTSQTPAQTHFTQPNQIYRHAPEAPSSLPMSRPPSPSPAFESFGHGREVRTQSERGQQSRSFAPANSGGHSGSRGGRR